MSSSLGLALYQREIRHYLDQRLNPSRSCSHVHGRQNESKTKRRMDSRMTQAFTRSLYDLKLSLNSLEHMHDPHVQALSFLWIVISCVPSREALYRWNGHPLTIETHGRSQTLGFPIKRARYHFPLLWLSLVLAWKSCKSSCPAQIPYENSQRGWAAVNLSFSFRTPSLLVLRQGHGQDFTLSGLAHLFTNHQQWHTKRHPREQKIIKRQKN